MTPQEAKGLVAHLAAAYPTCELHQPTVNLYGSKLEQLPVDVGRRVVEYASATYKFFPSLAELLQVVAELLVGAPDAYAAWAQVQAHTAAVNNPDTVPCVACNGSGYTDIDKDVLCATCNGQGEKRMSKVPLHPLVADSLRYMGGPTALLESDSPGIFQARWERAYKELVLRAHHDVQVGKGSWQLPAAEVRQLGSAG